jgi:hypothetical protein
VSTPNDEPGGWRVPSPEDGNAPQPYQPAHSQPAPAPPHPGGQHPAAPYPPGQQPPGQHLASQQPAGESPAAPGYQGAGPQQGQAYQPQGYQPQGYPGPGYQGEGYQGQGYPGQSYQGEGYQGRGYQAGGWGSDAEAAEPTRVGREVAFAALAAVAIAVLGLGLGLLWSAVAPQVPAVRVADGAVLAQPEQEQMIADEGWYLIITVLAGIAVAALAWVLLRRYRGAVVLLGVAVGAVAAGLLAFWLGHNLGLAHARDLAAHSAVGTTFSIPPNLRVQQTGLWHGWLPYAKGDVLAMAIASVVTYILLAGFSSRPDLRPAPAPEHPAQPAGPAGPSW